jgi:threonylcarbamoyladenosine tRNA methylthiotransferase CDKAL1
MITIDYCNVSNLIERIPYLNKRQSIRTTTFDANMARLSSISDKNTKIWIEAYGCAASMGDSEMITGLLKYEGYHIGNSEMESSLNIIVTCSVKDVTEHKMLHRIGQLIRTGKPLIVAGCLPKANKALLENKYPKVSLLGPHSINSTTRVVKSALSGLRAVVLGDSTSRDSRPSVRSSRRNCW